MIFAAQVLGWVVVSLVGVLTVAALLIPTGRQLLKEDVVILGQFVNDASLKVWFHRFSWPPRFITVHFYKPRHKPKNIILMTIEKSFGL